MKPLLHCLFATAVALSPAQAQVLSFPALVYATVQVGGLPQDLLLDLQVPSGTGPFPLVVWVHGGGWQGGSRLPIPTGVLRLLARGYAVASIDYRLTGAAIWPAQIHDCKAAIRFLRANASAWGLDPDRIGVMGSSAGGHLVAALATMGEVGPVRIGTFAVDLEGAVGPHLGTSSRVQAAVDQFGPTNMLLAHDLPTFDHDAATSPESLLVGGAIQQNPEKWASVDPISFLSPDDAPLLVMHGTDDTTVPFHQSQLLVDAARAMGTDVTFFPVQDTGHGGPGFSSPEATAAIDAFLDRTLREVPAVVVAVAAIDAQADENGDPAVFSVSRTGGTAAPLLVKLWLDGEVTAGADCEPLPLFCTIPGGQASTTVSLQPRQDGLVEGDERASLRLVSADHYAIAHGASSAQAILRDDEAPTGLPVVTFVAFDPAATEAAGNPGAIRCVRTGSTALPLTVQYEVAGSATNGLDCVALSGSVTIAANSNAALVVVTPLQDTAPEPGETVVLRLAAAGHYALGADRSAHVVIADDDRTGPLPTVGVLGTEPGLAEPADGGVFTLTRTGGRVQPLTVRFVVTGTATSGSDFVSLGTTAVIPAGAAWVRLPVALLDDLLVEGAETIALSIVADAAYRVGAASRHELWLADDEAPAPPPAAVQFVLSPLGVGQQGIASVGGGAPGGFASVWIGLLPGHVPVPPFGVVQLDPVLSGPFASAVLDAGGAATLPIVIPAAAALAGMPCWWQAFLTTSQAPFGAVSDPASRVLRGAAAF